MKQVVGLIGCGTVGAALYRQLSLLANEVELRKIAVKHPQKHRDLPTYKVTQDAMELVQDQEIGVVMEAINSSEDARLYALETLKQGKTYISASKKMLAEHLTELQQAERKYGGKLLYEAAVGGAIPIIRSLKEHLCREQISTVRGILNGTCNYILSSMLDADQSFEKALAEAQRAGYAETDPSSDVEGRDTFYKAVLIAAALEGDTPVLGRVMIEGISQVTEADVRAARKAGERLALVAHISKAEGKYQIDIRPRVLRPEDRLYGVREAMNGITVHGKHTGELFLSGWGAGGNATASAMVGDLYNRYNGSLQHLQRALKQLA